MREGGGGYGNGNCSLHDQGRGREGRQTAGLSHHQGVSWHSQLNKALYKLSAKQQPQPRQNQHTFDRLMQAAHNFIPTIPTLHSNRSQVGSDSAQGAGGPVMRDTITRVARALAKVSMGSKAPMPHPFSCKLSPASPSVPGHWAWHQLSAPCVSDFQVPICRHEASMAAWHISRTHSPIGRAGSDHLRETDTHLRLAACAPSFLPPRLSWTVRVRRVLWSARCGNHSSFPQVGLCVFRG